VHMHPLIRLPALEPKAANSLNTQRTFTPLTRSSSEVHRTYSPSFSVPRHARRYPQYPVSYIFRMAWHSLMMLLRMLRHPRLWGHRVLARLLNLLLLKVLLVCGLVRCHVTWRHSLVLCHASRSLLHLCMAGIIWRLEGRLVIQTVFIAAGWGRSVETGLG